jgi:hypothetical protein
MSIQVIRSLIIAALIAAVRGKAFVATEIQAFSAACSVVTCQMRILTF